MGVTLARLMPGKAQAILDRAEPYAERRLICAAHFRSDIGAGEAHGTAIALQFLRSPDFKREYYAVATEFASTHLQ